MFGQLIADLGTGLETSDLEAPFEKEAGYLMRQLLAIEFMAQLLKAGIHGLGASVILIRHPSDKLIQLRV